MVFTGQLAAALAAAQALHNPGNKEALRDTVFLQFCQHFQKLV